MSFETFAWAFAGAVILHNLEEAIWLPAWTKAEGRWRISVGAAEFRFAVVVLTALVYACAWLATKESPLGFYLLCGYALAMFLNAFVPHLAATVILRGYAPGTATALLINAPTSILLLHRAITERRIQISTFTWAGPLTALALTLLIPALFWIGSMLRSTTCKAESTRKSR